MKERTDISNYYYLLMRDGDKVVDVVGYTQESDFSEGLSVAWIEIEKGKHNTRAGYVNTRGEIAIPPMFDRAYMFRDGIAAVEVDSKYGLIDKHGIYIIKPEFETTSALCEEANNRGFQADYKTFSLMDFSRKRVDLNEEQPILPEYGIRIIEGSDGKKGIASVATDQTLIEPTYDEIYAVTMEKSSEIFSIHAIRKKIVYERDDDFARYYEDRWNTYF